jgi:hypothetical protein
MGCFQSTGSIDFDSIQSTILRSRGGEATYSGTTERGQCQVRTVYFVFVAFLFESSSIVHLHRRWVMLILPSVMIVSIHKLQIRDVAVIMA